jgi:hypothetical protein
MDSQRLARDLKLFADPATDVRWKEVAGKMWIEMIRDGTERAYTIDLNTLECVSRHGGGKQYSSVQALLASDEFVNLRAFRATQRRLLAAKNPEQYIEPEGQLLAKDGTSAVLNLDSFRTAMVPAASDRLALLLLDGPAGIGKTSLIERLVYERAEPSAPLPPLLHVVSSGSRLTDLSKALAHATQILRSSVTFDQIPVLVRLGVLQVAIDGFDELVDPEGYKDAWSALRQFLAEVHFGGPIVLSGRDTFFDQQSFEARLASRVSNLHLTHGRLYPVSPLNAVRYLRSHGWSDAELRSAESRDWFRPGSYRLRPFFLSQIAEQGSWQDLEQAHGSPQSFLVDRFVAREADIVSRMVEISRPDAESALWDFYGSIVEDMATNETEFVDEPFLALACETAFEGRVNTGDLAKLVYKAGSFGLLESDGSQGLRRLPHSELQNQFLARNLVNGLNSSASATSFLRRGVVGSGLLEAFADVVSQESAPSAQQSRDKLMRIVVDEPFSERLVSNCASLALATLARSDLLPLSLSSVSLSDARIFGTAGRAIVDGVTFSHLDLRGADCRAITFRECTAAALTVDSITYFGGSQPPRTHLLQVENAGAITFIRVPVEISNWVGKHSASTDGDGGDADLPLVQYFDRVCRKFVRQHQIRNSDSDEAYYLLRDPAWLIIRPLVGDRLYEDSREARGPKNIFYRMIRPEALLNPPADDEESRRIRRAVVEAARSSAVQ